MNLLKLTFICLIVVVSEQHSRSQYSWADKHQEEPKKLNQTEKNGTQDVPEIPDESAFAHIFPRQEHEKTTTKQESTSNEAWYSPSVIIQIGLFIVGCIYSFFACLQWRAIRSQTNTTQTHLRIIERAYVRMSHLPPGLIVEKERGLFRMTVQVKNFGRIPARVTDAFLKSRVLPSNESLPDIPDYGGTREKGNTLKAFLVTEDECFAPWEFSIGVENIPGIEVGTKKLWLYGYVDYIDQFGQRHRAGYARVYDLRQDDRNNYRSDEDFDRRSNLVFAAQDGYSYDRPRKKGEGNDWKEETKSN